jgi:hypothetical protein
MVMATAERNRPQIVVGDSAETARKRLLSEHTALNAARVLWSVGLIFLVGSLADLVLAWAINNRPGDPVWEFNQLAGTIEGTPRIVLALALIWVALYIRGSVSVIIQRVFGFMLILLGIAGAVIGAMMISDYFVIRGNIPPEDTKLFLSIVLKTLTLSALHLVLLIPVGVLSVRRPRG